MRWPLQLVRPLRRRRGLVVAEFLILAPCLIALLLGAVYLHRQIEKRIALEIASRNVAFLALPQESQAAEAIIARHSQTDLFGAMVSGEVVAPAGGAALAAAEEGARRVLLDPALTAALAGSSPPLSATRTPKSGFDAAARYDGLNANDSLNSISQGLAALTKVGTFAFDVLAGACMQLGSPLGTTCLLMSQPFAQSVVSLSYAVENDGFEGILERFASSNGSSPLGLSTVMASSLWLRQQAGYHPNEYSMSPIIGIGFGLLREQLDGKKYSWGDRKTHYSRPFPTYFNYLRNSFASDCMYNLHGGTDCRNPEGLVAVLYIGAFVKAIIDAIASIFSAGAANGAASAADVAKNAAVGAITSSLVDALGTSIAALMPSFDASLQAAMSQSIAALDDMLGSLDRDVLPELEQPE